MSVKEVKRFLDEVKNKRELSEIIREKLNGEFFSENKINSLVEEEIIPLARKHNFDVTKADLEKFVEQQESGPLELDLDDLENVAGGRSLFVKSAFSMFLCLTEFVSFAYSNFVHAVGDPYPSGQEFSAQKTEDKGSEQESNTQNTEDKVFEISDIVAGVFNPEDVHKLKLSDAFIRTVGNVQCPNLSTVIISKDYTMGERFLCSFLINSPSIKYVKVEDDNEDYILVDGVLCDKKDNMKKIWISDIATEISISDSGYNLLETNRVYNNLRKINLTKDSSVNINKLRAFKEKNPRVTIDVEEGNKYYTKKEDGKVYYLPFQLPIDWDSEKIENLDLFCSCLPVTEAFENFKNLKTITLHPGYKMDLFFFYNWTKGFSNIDVKLSGPVESYKEQNKVLFYKGNPIHGDFNNVTEINIGEVNYTFSKTIKFLRNLKIINVKNSYKDNPSFLVETLLNNPEARIVLRDESGNEVQENENYFYDVNGLLYHKKTGLPITRNFDEIEELTLKSKFVPEYFDCISQKGATLKSLKKINFSKDFFGFYFDRRAFWDLIPNLEEITVDKENPNYIVEKNLLKEKNKEEAILDVHGRLYAKQNQKLIDYLPKTFEECKPYLNIREASKYKDEYSYKNISEETKLKIAKKVVEILKDSPEQDISLKSINLEGIDSNQVYEELKGLNDEIKSRTDRAHKIYRWMSRNIAYNKDDLNKDFNFDIYWNGIERNYPGQVFENGYGVCRGFARLANVMLRLAEVPSIYVSSYFYSEGGHAFNLIFTGEGETGDWALMDATWGSDKIVNIPLIGPSLPVYYKGAINEDFFPHGDIQKFNRGISREKFHFINSFKLREKNIDGSFVKFRISDSEKKVRIKKCLIKNGTLFFPERIKGLGDFCLQYEGDAVQGINQLDLTDCKIKIDNSIFKLGNFNKQNIVLNENSNYVWENDILYYKDENTKFPIYGDIGKAESFTLTSVTSFIVDEILKLENLRTLIIEKDFFSPNLKKFLSENPQIENIIVKDGNQFYSMDENGVLYYKYFLVLGEGPGEEPFWVKKDVESLTLSNRTSFILDGNLNFEKLKTVIIENDFDSSKLMKLEKFLDNNTSIENVIVKDENPFYSKDEKGVLCWRKDTSSPRIPFWVTQSSNDICCGKGWAFFMRKYKTLENLKILTMESDFNVSVDCMIKFLEKNPQIECINVEGENSIYSYNKEEDVLYYTGGGERLPVCKFEDNKMILIKKEKGID